MVVKSSWGLKEHLDFQCRCQLQGCGNGTEQVLIFLDLGPEELMVPISFHQKGTSVRLLSNLRVNVLEITFVFTEVKRPQVFLGEIGTSFFFRLH